MLQHPMRRFGGFFEVVRRQRQTAQADFFVKKIKRIRGSGRAKSRVTTAAERGLKSALKSHGTRGRRVERSGEERRFGGAGLHRNRGLADGRNHMFEAE